MITVNGLYKNFGKLEVLKGIDCSEMAKMMIISLLGYVGGSTVFFLALLYIPASLASMLLYTYPVMVALAETVLFKQPLTRAKALAILLASAGLVMIQGTNFQGINPLGTVLALAAAVFYTAYLIYSKRVNSNHPSLVTTGYILAFAAVAYLGFPLLDGAAYNSARRMGLSAGLMRG